MPLTSSAVTVRPPSVPLVAHDPYFSIWSSADKLADAPTTHWTGKPHRLGSLVRIDGTVYRLMGDAPTNVAPLPQTGVEVLPTRTICTFSNAAIRLTLSFTTPALPAQLDLLSRPVTYVTWEAAAADQKEHAVSVYLDCAGEIAVNTPDQEVTWAREHIEGIAAARIGSKDQPVLAKSGDDLRIDWGWAYLAAPQAKDVRITVAAAEAARALFATNGTLPAHDARQPRRADDACPTLALALDLGKVGPKPVSRYAMIGYDDLVSINYLGDQLKPYWRRKGAQMTDILRAAVRDHDDIATNCAAFDTELMTDLVTVGGNRYAQIAALAYRQCLAGNKLVASSKTGRPLLFPKENFSNGCVGTVDVIYPMAPMFLLFGADLARAMVVPILDYAALPRWKFPFAPHDLGTYPLATGQVYGGGEKTEENQMPVEESANLILLAATVTMIEGSPAFAAQYWPELSKWADYLKAKGLDPDMQLCTDDFAGHLAHNVNLSAKAILALDAFAKLCDIRGMKKEAMAYHGIAKEFAAKWRTMADDGGHTRLAFDKQDTWSQKYNLVWDRILGLNLFPSNAIAGDLQFYRTKQGKYGLPLDSRATYTKLDWILWTACLTDNQKDFEAFVEPVWRWLNETPDRVPMSDWYETGSGHKVGFVARPVVGGVFMRMLYDVPLWKKWYKRGERSDTSLPFPVGNREWLNK